MAKPELQQIADTEIPNFDELNQIAEEADAIIKENERRQKIEETKSNLEKLKKEYFLNQKNRNKPLRYFEKKLHEISQSDLDEVSLSEHQLLSEQITDLLKKNKNNFLLIKATYYKSNNQLQTFEAYLTHLQAITIDDLPDEEKQAYETLVKKINCEKALMELITDYYADTDRIKNLRSYREKLKAISKELLSATANNLRINLSKTINSEIALQTLLKKANQPPYHPSKKYQATFNKICRDSLSISSKDQYDVIRTRLLKNPVLVQVKKWHISKDKQKDNDKKLARINNALQLHQLWKNYQENESSLLLDDLSSYLTKIENLNINHLSTMNSFYAWFKNELIEKIKNENEKTYVSMKSTLTNCYKNNKNTFFGLPRNQLNIKVESRFSKKYDTYNALQNLLTQPEFNMAKTAGTESAANQCPEKELSKMMIDEKDRNALIHIMESRYINNRTGVKGFFGNMIFLGRDKIVSAAKMEEARKFIKQLKNPSLSMNAIEKIIDTCDIVANDIDIVFRKNENRYKYTSSDFRKTLNDIRIAFNKTKENAVHMEKKGP